MTKKFTVRVFNGTETTIYTTEATDVITAEQKIAEYHIALTGETNLKVTATERRG